MLSENMKNIAVSAYCNNRGSRDTSIWAAVEAVLAEQARAGEQWHEDNYVAWGCYGKNGRNETIIKLCDSDAPGAFKMFRACNQVHSEDIGALRASLLMSFDCNWNGLVRDVTAQYETDGKSNVYEVFKELVSLVRQSGYLDHLFPERNRIKDLFADKAGEQGQHEYAECHCFHCDGDYSTGKNKLCAVEGCHRMKSDNIHKQSAQPSAGDVVERMVIASDAAYHEVLRKDGDSITPAGVKLTAMAAALAVARDGYVRLEDVETALNDSSYQGLLDFSMAAVITKHLRTRLAKPAEPTDAIAEKINSVLRHYLQGQTRDDAVAEIVAALKAGKQ